MKLIVNKDRTTIPVGTWGTKNENDYEILEFEFPEELENYNKRIVYYLGNERVWDTIVDNKAYITNAITQYSKVKAYVWLTKENTEREADTDFRTKLFEMKFYDNDNADGIVPTEQQIDGFNTMLTAMNRKTDEVNALEQTILQAETERQENENTRISNESTRESNESTRQTNEQTRQSQEAERERKTAEAIADIQDKTAEYNQNAEEKTEAFNTNAENKTSAFNTNASAKTTDFDNNASDKTTAFDNNASDKTTTFNENATSKTNDFNDNASAKTTAFNDNVTQKTTDFNNNAQAKTDAFDEHTAEMQQEIDELSANMPWNTTEQATEISVDDAAKYSKNKLELFGNTEQVQYTGVQLLDISDAVNGYFADDAGNANTSISGFHTQEYIDVGNNTSIYGRFEALDNIRIGRLFIQEYNENKESIKRHTIGIYDSVFTLGQVRKWNINLSEGTKYIRLSNYTLQKLEGESYVNQIPTKDYWNDLVKATISFTDVDIYEPYVGGVPAPNPDYPQDIHVVKGHNEFKIANADDTEFQTLELDLPEGMEMCKLGIQDNKYREDFFFKNTENSQYYNSELNLNSWYKKQSIKHIKFDNTSSVWGSKNEVDQTFTFAFPAEIYASNWSIEINNYIKYWRGLFVETGSLIRYDGAPVFIIKFNEFGFNSDLTANQAEELFREKLATTPLDIYYDMREGHNKSGLYTIDVEITDETLIAQLDAIYEHLQLVKGTNNITVTAEDLAPYMKLSYMQDLKSKLDNLDSRLSLLE